MDEPLMRSRLDRPLNRPYAVKPMQVSATDIAAFGALAVSIYNAWVSRSKDMPAIRASFRRPSFYLGRENELIIRLEFIPGEREVTFTRDELESCYVALTEWGDPTSEPQDERAAAQPVGDFCPVGCNICWRIPSSREAESPLVGFVCVRLPKDFCIPDSIPSIRLRVSRVLPLFDRTIMVSQT